MCGQNSSEQNAADKMAHIKQYGFAIQFNSINFYLVKKLQVSDFMVEQPALGTAHQYVDDTQAFRHGPVIAAISQVETVLEVTAAMELWMFSNRLHMNSVKAQFIWLDGRAQLAKIDKGFLSVRFPDVRYSDLVRDLVATLDLVLSLSDYTCICVIHVNSVLSVRPIHNHCSSRCTDLLELTSLTPSVPVSLL